MKTDKITISKITVNNQSMDNYTPQSYLREYPELFKTEVFTPYLFILAILDSKGMVKSKLPFKNELIVNLKNEHVHFVCFSHRNAYYLVLRDYDQEFSLKKLTKYKSI